MNQARCKQPEGRDDVAIVDENVARATLLSRQLNDAGITAWHRPDPATALSASDDATLFVAIVFTSRDPSFASTTFSLLRQSCASITAIAIDEDTSSVRRSYLYGLGYYDVIAVSGEALWEALRPSLERARERARLMHDKAQAERVALTSEARFRDFAELGSDWFWESDASGRFTYVSQGDAAIKPPAETLLGMTREEIHAARIRPTPNANSYLRAIALREPYSDKELEWVVDDNRSVFIRHSGRPFFDEEGNFLGYRGVGRDISAPVRARDARARLEAQLRESQKMETVGQLAGGVAHDFNNILGSVLGYLELSLGYHVDDPDSKLAHYLRESKLAAERARDLIRQLLLYSRGGEGELVLHPAAAAVSDAAALLRRTLPQSVDVELEVRAELPFIRTQVVQLAQVLINLCVNAFQALGDDGGTVSISAEVLRLERRPCASCSIEIDGEFVAIRVRDDGIGIPPSVRARMFEPFYSTRGPHEGTGMGLSVVHGIVHDHSGHILVESNLGEGTSLTILLPTATARSIGPFVDLPEAAPDADTILDGRNVLIVDDEIGFGEFVRDLLSLHGCVADVEMDGQSGLTRFLATPGHYDVVIADFAMPGFTGTELAESLLAVQPSLPIILCTGVMERVSEEDTSALGIRAVLRKPVTSAALLSHLRRCLTG